MPITIECPNGCRFQAPAQASATQIRCPSCRQIIAIDSQPNAGIYSASLIEVEHPAETATDFLSSLTAGTPEPVDFFPELNVSSASEAQPTDVKAKDVWAQRVAVRLNGRRSSARLYAWSLGVLAGVTMIPPFLWWWEWANQVVAQTTLPRWVYLSLFLMGLQLFYALMIRVIPDWSSLRAASFFLLVLACLLAVASAGLSMPVTSNVVARWLQVPYSLQARGTIWCLALVCLNLLLSFWAYREYLQWRRTEDLFHELFPQNVSQST